MIRLLKSRVPDKLDIKDILKTKMVSNHKNVRKLEKKLCQVHKVKHAICFANATTACSMIFYVLHPKTVAMPSFTWVSTKLALDAQKIKMKYMDIDPETWVVPASEQKKQANADLFLLNATFGNKPEVLFPEKTIIDSAHCGAHPGFGNLALAEFISFSPSKTFTGIEGGAVLTNNDYLADRLRYFQPIMGRMGEINAKVALINLNERASTFAWKKKVLQEYTKKLLNFHKFQIVNEYHTWNEIGILCPHWKKEQWDLINKKMEVRKRFNPVFVGNEKFPYSRYVYENIVMLPSYPGCDYKKVIKAIQDVDRTV